MANDVEKKIKIEDLPKATELADTDLFPIVQGAEGHRITRAVEASLIKAASGASALTELSDVTISSPTDGQVIKYDSSSDKWVNADAEGSSQAEDVAYSNAQSHLDATNVQEAIDEVAAKMGGGTAEDITFDDTNVTFTANNVQSAFENIVKKLTQEEYDALTPDEQLNGTIYFIVDGEAPVSGAGVIATPVSIRTDNYTEEAL